WSTATACRAASSSWPSGVAAPSPSKRRATAPRRSTSWDRNPSTSSSPRSISPTRAGCLLRRLAQEQRLRSTPFVFLAPNGRADARVAAFRAGADDYVTKPIDPEELLARVEALVTRRRRERDEARRRSYTLAGDFASLPFPDLVSLLGMSQRSGS